MPSYKTKSGGKIKTVKPIPKASQKLLGMKNTRKKAAGGAMKSIKKKAKKGAVESFANDTTRALPPHTENKAGPKGFEYKRAGGGAMKKKGYAKGGAMKKKGMAKGGKLKMVEKNGKKVPFFAADGKGKMAAGGKVAKKPAKKMASGGKTKSKSKTTLRGEINKVMNKTGKDRIVPGLSDLAQGAYNYGKKKMKSGSKKTSGSMSGLRKGDVAAKRGGMMKKKGYAAGGAMKKKGMKRGGAMKRSAGGTVRGAGAATRGKRFSRSG